MKSQHNRVVAPQIPPLLTEHRADHRPRCEKHSEADTEALNAVAARLQSDVIRDLKALSAEVAAAKGTIFSSKDVATVSVAERPAPTADGVLSGAAGMSQVAADADAVAQWWRGVVAPRSAVQPAAEVQQPRAASRRIAAQRFADAAPPAVQQEAAAVRRVAQGTGAAVVAHAQPTTLSAGTHAAAHLFPWLSDMHLPHHNNKNIRQRSRSVLARETGTVVYPLRTFAVPPSERAAAFRRLISATGFDPELCAVAAAADEASPPALWPSAGFLEITKASSQCRVLCTTLLLRPNEFSTFRFRIDIRPASAAPMFLCFVPRDCCPRPGRDSAALGGFVVDYPIRGAPGDTLVAECAVDAVKENGCLTLTVNAASPHVLHEFACNRLHAGVHRVGVTAGAAGSHFQATRLV
jgi:hypothetical protein